MKNEVEVSACLTVSSEKFHRSLPSIKETLTFYNPFEPTEVFLGYVEKDGLVKFPRASIKNLDSEFSKTIDKTVSSVSNFKTKPGFALKDYQEVAEQEILEYISKTKNVEALNILLSAATGSGKTYMLSSVLSKLGQKVLFLSHLSMLSDQVALELKANTTASISILNRGTVELSDINIATFQLLNNNPELLNVIANEVSVLVVDETENMASASRIAVLFQLRVKVAIFVSATPTKELVKRTKLIESFITHKVTMESEGIPIIYAMLDYRAKTWDAPYDKMQYRSSLFTFLKTEKILDDVIDLTKLLVSYEGTVWIIASLDKLHRYLEAKFDKLKIPCRSIQGATSKKLRNEVLSGIERGEIKVIISSAPISAGISIPQISAGIRLEPHSSSDELLVQQEGRLKRNCNFKTYQKPIWFDMAINGSLAFKGKQRFTMYNSKGGCKILTKELIPSFIEREWSLSKINKIRRVNER